MCRLAKHNDTNELQRLVALMEFLVLACLFMMFYKINEILRAACLVKIHKKLKFILEMQ